MHTADKLLQLHSEKDLSVNDAKDVTNNDEIDLVVIITPLWKKKWHIAIFTFICAALAYAWHSTLPTQWLATSYISPPSFYDFFKEIHLQVQSPEVNRYGFSQAGVYKAIKTETFSTAVGILAVKGVNVADPVKGSNIYTVSLVSDTEDSARSQLKSHLDAANTEAIAFNLPELTENKKIKAFNYLGELSGISTAKVQRSLKSFIFLGIVAGLLISCTLVLSKEYVNKHIKSQS